MTTINESGFLSEEISEFIKSHRAEHAHYFDLCEDLNTFSHHMLLGLQIHNEYLPEIFVAMYFARALSNFQGTVLLSERGMNNESKILLRALLEVMFAVVAISKDKEVATQLVEADILERKDALKAFGRQASAGIEFFSDQKVTEELARLEWEVANAEKERPTKEITKRYLAEKAGVVTTYDSAYKLLSASVHAPVRDLEQYLDVDPNGNISSLLWGPNKTEIALVLMTGAHNLLAVLDAVSKIFDLPITTEHQQLLDRYKKLGESFPHG
ncbi:MAG TPA: DUF5677 domain-containing protein [Sedimentisphaerales bacterium]|nr:DUF5677 domain-containing protein [Sedimentisphaerales bacterium]